jgi:hypothetical protein
MNTDQFANTSRGGSTCIGGRLYGSDISANEDRHVARTDVLLPDQLNIRGFDHGISRLYGADESFGFHHSECF